MEKSQILAALPGEIVDKVDLEESEDHFRLRHPFLEDKHLFDRVRDIITKGLKGKYFGYYDGAANYEIPILANSEGQARPPSQQTTAEPVSVPEFQMVPVDSLLSMPLQSRLSFDEGEIGDLAESIRVHGILEPLLVRPKSGGYFEVVAGERRRMAAEKAELTSVPCLVRQLTDQQAMEVHLIENDQRKDLTDFERGRMYSEMLQRFSEAYPSIQALADKIGKSRKFVSNHIHHYQFLEQTGTRVPLDFSKIEEIPEATTREIRRAPAEKQSAVAEKAIVEGLSSRETKRLVDSIKGVEPEPEKRFADAVKEVKIKLSGGETQLYQLSEIKEISREDGFWIIRKDGSVVAITEESFNLLNGMGVKEEKPVKQIDWEAEQRHCPACKQPVPDRLYVKIQELFPELFT